MDPVDAAGPSTPHHSAHTNPVSPVRKRKGQDQLRMEPPGEEDHHDRDDKNHRGNRHKNDHEQEQEHNHDKDREHHMGKASSDDELSLKTEKRRLHSRTPGKSGALFAHSSASPTGKARRMTSSLADRSQVLEPFDDSPDSTHHSTEHALTRATSHDSAEQGPHQGPARPRVHRSVPAEREVSSAWDSSDSSRSSGYSVRDPDEDEVYHPLDENVMRGLPPTMREDLRRMQEERRQRIAARRALGTIPVVAPPTEPSSPGLGGAGASGWESPVRSTSGRTSGSIVSAPRILRVVNGSERTSSPPVQHETTMSGALEGTSTSPSFEQGEDIVPMTHWRSEARRIGMPANSPPTSPEKATMATLATMTTVATRVAGRARPLGGRDHGPDTAASASASSSRSEQTGRSKSTSFSMRQYLRRPFASGDRGTDDRGSSDGSPKKRHGTYFDRMFRRGKSSEEESDMNFASLKNLADCGLIKRSEVPDKPDKADKGNMGNKAGDKGDKGDADRTESSTPGMPPTTRVRKPTATATPTATSTTTSTATASTTPSHSRKASSTMTYRGKVEKYE
ncbi:MAG: hypothetical protein M1838_001381 [Thelocarpon superellum]|nr:MAG: hypothetical protein M1838_001381 [Thelocarpon superellum]